MPGAVWCETGPKERIEEGAPHSPFVVWNPLIQQQRETTSASCAISLRNCKVALTMSDGNYNGNIFWTVWLEAESDRKWVSTFRWRNEWTGKNKSWSMSKLFFFGCSNLNKAVKSTAVWCMWVELLPRDSRAFSQGTRELSGLRANQRDSSVTQAHFTDTVLGIILLTQSQNWSVNPCSGESIIDSNEWPLWLKVFS